MSRVNVIVPCYNYGHYLRECVESVLSQEGVDVRVLIIDDCSPDNTPQVAAELMARDSRIEYRRHENNIGHIATYNEGLEWASGDYLLLLSADDLLFRGALFRAASFMDRNSQVGMVHGRSTNRPGESPSSIGSDGTWQIVTGWNFISEICQTGENVISTPTVVVRTSLQKKLGGYRKELPHAGDMEMWLRFAAASSVGFINAYQACHRMHNQNMSEIHFRDQRDLCQRRDAFALFFADIGNRVAHASQLKLIASRALSQEALWQATKAFEDELQRVSQSWLELSREINPSIRKTKQWKGFQLKRFVGARAWKRVKPMLRFCRKALAAPNSGKRALVNR